VPGTVKGKEMFEKVLNMTVCRRIRSKGNPNMAKRGETGTGGRGIFKRHFEAKETKTGKEKKTLTQKGGG